MIDTKTKLVLGILVKECGNDSYKIIDASDIIMALPRHFRIDSTSVKHILTHLENQDMISIKYEDDDTYCVAVLPMGFEALENQKPKLMKTRKLSEKQISWLTIFFSFLSAFLGTTFGILICFYFLKII